MELFAWNFFHAEAEQVSGGELRIQQHEPAVPQARDQMGQRDFRRIGDAGEHALPKERAFEAHAVKPAHKLAA